ncbi:Protein of unknown function [Lactobacillus helveticus CIRM-BIA 101]|uniref:Uncharacterized protein n=3 Tax=Lactobacillus helveticus TaxID=1587 RepID=U4QCG9_LACHE|nr:Protein of unknown function [Lactobacillus helveticus CIRM-BIA 953]CDI58481.1 Protein of unknown function [Lactobacillus helveticus CIRM-BIA 951]CDI60515.1 Protein of unknown function [Lactobacillus helveticus CIRM-BIA 104]CDI64405.1 Protein of unknown function [Lactobacillus helveticus CIRM-BIA 101]
MVLKNQTFLRLLSPIYRQEQETILREELD